MMVDLAKMLSNVGGKFGYMLRKNSTQILVGLSIGGFGASIVTAIKATKKATVAVEEAREERKTNHFNEESGHWETGVVNDLTTSEKLKIELPYYAPTIITAGASAACIVAGVRGALIGKEAMAAAYAGLLREYTDYKKSVAESVDEKQKKTIEQKADKRTIQRAEESGVLQNLSVLPGDVKCYERFTGRVFSSNKDKLIKITNELNRRMRSENYISLNDFYDELDLTNTGLGYELGWNIDRGYIEPKFSAQLDSDGKPCLVLDFEIPPQSDYTNW